MKKVQFLSCIICFFLLLSITNITCAQNKQLKKQYSKMYKVKIKEYKKEGWKLDSSSKTLEVALLEHYKKLSRNCRYYFKLSIY